MVGILPAGPPWSAATARALGRKCSLRSGRPESAAQAETGQRGAVGSCWAVGGQDGWNSRRPGGSCPSWRVWSRPRPTWRGALHARPACPGPSRRCCCRGEADVDHGRLPSALITLSLGGSESTTVAHSTMSMPRSWRRWQAGGRCARKTSGCSKKARCSAWTMTTMGRTGLMSEPSEVATSSSARLCRFGLAGGGGVYPLGAGQERPQVDGGQAHFLRADDSAAFEERSASMMRSTSRRCRRRSDSRTTAAGRGAARWRPPAAWPGRSRAGEGR